MPHEFIRYALQEGFPKITNDERSYRTQLRYIDDYWKLEQFNPPANSTWGLYDGRVASSRLDPITGTNPLKGILEVTCEYFYDSSVNASGGTAREVTFEVEWVMFQRSMYEHPEFAIGGGGTYQLTSYDIAGIEAWKNQTDPALRERYLWQGATSPQPLSTNAKMFARGIELGQEFYEDYAPVIRRIINYTGATPSSTDAGDKGGEPSFPGKPSGYEWRKIADRAVQVDGQTRWNRVEEWIGAEEVLTDKANIYWTAPT